MYSVQVVEHTRSASVTPVIAKYHEITCKAVARDQISALNWRPRRDDMIALFFPLRAKNGDCFGGLLSPVRFYMNPGWLPKNAVSDLELLKFFECEEGGGRGAD